MKERIKFSCYTPAPETARASVNGQPLDLTGTRAAEYIACRNIEKARAELKRIYRKQNRKQDRFIYAFFAKESKQFYYIAVLSFTAADDIQTRLRCYKELKHHLQKNPPTITTESGYFTPDGATPPTRKTETARIDFSRAVKIKIA